MKKNLEHVLQSTFGLESFREGQEEIISSICKGNDTLVFMPTGGGKSLTYQLPGMLREGIAIVVSPLISLMKDQVDALRELGIRAELINSTLSRAEQRDILDEIRGTDYSVIPPILNSFPPREKEATSFTEDKKKYIINLARELRKKGTQEEEIMWEILRRKNLGYKFRRQHPFGRYIADFYSDELKIVIELDGKIHQNQEEYDTIRTEIISQYGVKVIRIDNEQIHENIAGVIDKIISLSPLGGKMSEGQIGGNPIKFLYIAPERLNSNEFVGVLKNTKISLVAIDEAHCISQWGHDFRPSYMKIKSFIESLAGENRTFPVVGLTATATQKVRKDIVERLGIGKYTSFITGFDRKNIILVVREISQKDEKQEKVQEIIEKTPGTGIIYCSSRKHVIELSEYLISKGIKTGVYKGDLSPEVRESEQNKFMNDEYKVMVATNAFGMGIDKKDIRFVVHYNLPGSIENYYQEVGRAGRDGKMSYGIVLASYGDTKIQEFFIDNTYPDKKTVLDFYDYLYKEQKLGDGKGVRIAKTYYTMASESGVGNDMIVGSIVKILEKYNILRRGLEASDSEADFRGRGLTLLQEKRQHSHLMIDWKRQENLKEEGYFKLEQIKRLLFYPSCRKRFILEYFGDEEDLRNLGDNCGLCDFCLESGNVSEEDKKKFLPASTYAVVLETVKKYNEKFGTTLLAKLLSGSHDKRIDQWHLDTYEHYGVFSDMTLEMVTAMFEALIMEDFLFKTDGQYPCVGVTEYGGAAIYKNVYITQNLSDLNAYVMQKVKNTSRKSSGSSAKSSGKKMPKGQTYKDTLELFMQGKNLKEISKQRGLGLQTIEGHIIELYTQGEISLMKVLDMIDLETAKKVKTSLDSELIQETGLKPIKEKLEMIGEKNISYFEIKLTLAMIEKGDL